MGAVIVEKGEECDVMSIDYPVITFESLTTLLGAVFIPCLVTTLADGNIC